MANFFVYLCFSLFIALCCAAAFMRFRDGRFSPGLYVLMLVPSVLLVYGGMMSAKGRLHESQIVIMGYKFSGLNGSPLTFGSSPENHYTLSHKPGKGKELFSPRLFEISTRNASGASELTLRLKDRFTPNVVEVNGRPIRSLKITPGIIYRITFGAYGYRSDKGLDLVVKDGKAFFQYNGKFFHKGFSKELMGGFLLWRHGEHTIRNLGIYERIDLGKNTKDLLKQAALYWTENGEVFLAAEDADIRLEEHPPGADAPEVMEFPRETGPLGGECKVRIYSRQLGEFKRIGFRVEHDRINETITLELDKRHQQTAPLPSTPDLKVCLTNGKSPFAKVFDVSNRLFQPGGMVIKKVDDGFLYRGEKLDWDEPYLCGRTVFRLESPKAMPIGSLAWIGIAFLLCGLFYPWGVFRREPLAAIVLASSVFLLAFRQLLSFRAWAGEPHNLSCFQDSIIAPLFFIFTVLVVTESTDMGSLAKAVTVRIWNFLFSERPYLKPAPFPPLGASGQVLGLIILYGLILTCFFGADFGLRFNRVFIAFMVFAIVLATPLAYLIRWIFRFISYAGLFHPGVLIGLSLLMMAGAIATAPMLGGKEVVSILPGRFRPDIVIQIVLLFFVAYLAEFWQKAERKGKVPIWTVLISFAVPLAMTLLHVFLAEDLGFAAVVWPPVLVMAFLATYHMESRGTVVQIGLLIAAVAGVFGALQLDMIDQSSFQEFRSRFLFAFDPLRLKAESFGSYLAHLPVVWSANQGLFGAGFFQGVIDGTLRSTCVNDHVSSVFIQGEFGAAGTLLTMLVYLCFSVPPLLAVYCSTSYNQMQGGRFAQWVVAGGALMIFWTAAYMFMANASFLPLTGKNLPLLGLDSLNDCIRYGLLTGIILRLMSVLPGSRGVS